MRIFFQWPKALQRRNFFKALSLAGLFRLGRC